MGCCYRTVSWEPKSQRSTVGRQEPPLLHLYLLSISFLLSPLVPMVPTPPPASQPLSGPFGLTRCRDCNDGALFTLGVLVCEAGPGAGCCSCSTLQLRDLPNLGRVPWPKAKKNFFSPRVVMLLLAFLFLSEGAAEGGPGPALTPGRSLKCKGGHEVGGRGLWKRGRTSP